MCVHTVYMVNNMNGSKTVRVSEETHTRLEKIGVKGESFNHIISRLVDGYEGFMRQLLDTKKQEIDEYLSGKNPADYGAIPIGNDAYNTAGLIRVRLDKHGLYLLDGTVAEDVGDLNAAAIIGKIEDWAQTLREEAPR